MAGLTVKAAVDLYIYNADSAWSFLEGVGIGDVDDFESLVTMALDDEELWRMAGGDEHDGDYAKLEQRCDTLQAERDDWEHECAVLEEKYARLKDDYDVLQRQFGARKEERDG